MVVPSSSSEDRPQLPAAQSPDRLNLVWGGASSGKTQAIVERVLWLVKECSVSTKEIMVVAFTRRAAGQIAGRLQLALDETTRPLMDGLRLGTLHGLMADALRAEPTALARLGRTPDFIVLAADEQVRLLRQLLINHGRTNTSAARVRATIDNWASRGRGLAELAAEEEPGASAALVWDDYQSAKRGLDAFDFADLLSVSVALLETDQQLCERWTGQLRHILVDDAQDLNAIQLRLLELLAGPNAGLFLAGSPAQAIYGFNDARPSLMSALAARHADMDIHELTTNYRHSPQVIGLANALMTEVEDAPKLTSDGVADNGPEPVFRMSSDEDSEALFIAADISARLSAGTQPGDIAILVRTRAQIAVLERALASARLPYHLLDGGLAEQKGVSELIIWLRCLLNRRDGAAFHQALRSRSGISEAFLRELDRFVADAGGDWRDGIDAALVADAGGTRARAALRSARELLQRLDAAMALPLVDLLAYAAGEIELADSTDPTVIQNLSALGTLAASHEGGLASFIEFGLWGVDPVDPDRLVVSTLHAAKGRTWRCVFIAGVEEGCLPASDEPAVVEEDRRLLYHGITRATEEIQLSGAASRRAAGARQLRSRSRFIDAMEEALLIAPVFMARRARRINRRAQADPTS